jgi:hypothetical protein
MSDDPRGAFFVFDGVMVLAAGSVLQDRQDVFFNCAVCVKLFRLCVTSRVLWLGSPATAERMGTRFMAQAQLLSAIGRLARQGEVVRDYAK